AATSTIPEAINSVTGRMLDQAQSCRRTRGGRQSASEVTLLRPVMRVSGLFNRSRIDEPLMGGRGEEFSASKHDRRLNGVPHAPSVMRRHVPSTRPRQDISAESSTR